MTYGIIDVTKKLLDKILRRVLSPAELESLPQDILNLRLQAIQEIIREFVLSSTCVVEEVRTQVRAKRFFLQSGHPIELTFSRNVIHNGQTTPFHDIDEVVFTISVKDLFGLDQLSELFRFMIQHRWTDRVLAWIDWFWPRNFFNYFGDELWSAEGLIDKSLPPASVRICDRQ